MAGRLAGKVALITGSTSGIGRASAKLFALEGARVVVNGRRRELGESLVREIGNAGGDARYSPLDVSKNQSVRDLVAFTLDSYGRIDVLMNNAFNRVTGNAADTGEEQWDAHMALLLKAPYLACHTAIPYMVKQGGGSIINVSSVHGQLAGAGMFLYDVAKAGLINMARQIAIDYGPFGIRANALCPGMVVVERRAAVFEKDPELERQAVLDYPLRRVASPMEIAYSALFLASDESSFVTGTTLMVDGGLTCQLAEILYPRYEQYFRGRFRMEPIEPRT